jgi:hypothetical protein
VGDSASLDRNISDDTEDRRMADYRLEETFNDITLTYNGPGQDPVIADKDRAGDFEDSRFWRVNDGNADKYVLMNVSVNTTTIEVLTWWNKAKTWFYVIDVPNQKYSRIEKGSSSWSAAESVTNLRIFTDQEHPVLTVRISNGLPEAYVNPCRVVYNYATRRYTQVC